MHRIVNCNSINSHADLALVIVEPPGLPCHALPVDDKDVIERFSSFSSLVNLRIIEVCVNLKSID